MTQLWRIHLRPSSTTSRDVTPFCVRNAVLGIGWSVGHEGERYDWSTYESLARVKYKGDKSLWPAIRALKQSMQVDDLCWARDKQGVYYLSRISGPWEYQSAEA